MNATSEAATVVRSLFEAMEARDWALARTLISDNATIDWTETGGDDDGTYVIKVENFGASGCNNTYQLKVTVEDRVGDQQASRLIPIKVVADAALAWTPD